MARVRRCSSAVRQVPAGDAGGHLGAVVGGFQAPVAANHTLTPVGPVLNTIGATQGSGRVTLASIIESPEALALKSPVLTLPTASQALVTTRDR
jgi:hypothetical protein